MQSSVVAPAVLQRRHALCTAVRQHWSNNKFRRILDTVAPVQSKLCTCDAMLDQEGPVQTSLFVHQPL
jgi:hypothetical protein